MRGLIVLVAMLLAAASPAFAQCVRPNWHPRVNLTLAQPVPTYHHDLGVKALQTLGNSAEQAPSGWVRLGLTEFSDKFQANFSLIARKDGGEGCLWVDGLQAQLGDEQVNVYIAAEYPEGSCEYQAILAHENTHVRINLQTLADWLPRVRQVLDDTLYGHFPLMSPSQPGEAQARAIILGGVRTATAPMHEDMAKRNAAIDTVASYRRTQALCTHWGLKGRGQTG